MPRLTVLVVFLALAAALLAPGQASATDYANNPDPACRAMRNSAAGAPSTPGPNGAETRAAWLLGGARQSMLDNLPMYRQRFAQAFALLHKIDGEGTAALAQLPPDTPWIDFVIDRHLINLQWARAMLGTFYEEGRASPVDYGQAAAFYQKAIDTRFVDDRGCVHGQPANAGALIHLAGLVYYGLDVAKDRARAKALLAQAGANGASRLYLLDHDALPENYDLYLNADMDGLADKLQNPPPMDEWDATALVLGRILLWAAVALAFVIAAYVGVRLIRKRRGYQEQASVYRAVFAAYDVIHDALSRFGLVAQGLIECFIGLWMLLGYQFSGGAFGFSGFIGGNVFNAMLVVSGLTAFLGGIAKLIEAARFGLAPKSSGVHGSARPAASDEARAAARGEAGNAPARDQTFKE